MRKALVLGVGNAQVDIIRYLKETDWWVIGCSYRNEGRGLELVDQFELIDIVDVAALEELGRRERIDLIYSIGSDLAMPAVARVALTLDLPVFIPYETAELMQNKVMFRDFLASHDISPIAYKKVSGEADLGDWDSFPAIVKPADSQGQRGLSLANSTEEIAAGLRQALSFSRSGTAIVEEYLDGPEVSVNVFVIDSQVAVDEVSDRLVLEGYAGGIPRAHVLPTRTCGGESLRETRDLVERCIQALAIENGPVYFQIRLTAKGPRIIEVTPRLDGCHIWRLVRLVSGVDLLAASVGMLTGDELPSLKAGPRAARYRLQFFLRPPGDVFARADFPAPATAVHLEYYYANGEKVRPVNGLMEKVGYYIQQER